MRPINGFLSVLFIAVFILPDTLLGQLHLINDTDRYRGMGMGGSFSKGVDLFSVELSQAGGNKNAGGLGISMNFSNIIGFSGYFERLLFRGGDKIKPSLSAFATGGLFIVSEGEGDRSIYNPYSSKSKTKPVYNSDFQVFGLGVRLSFLGEGNSLNFSPYISVARNWLIINTDQLNGWPISLGLDFRLNPNNYGSPVLGVAYSIDESDNSAISFHLTLLTRLFDKK